MRSLLVQPRQRAELMTSRARGNRRHTGGAVWAMASQAARSHFCVRGLGFREVAARAHDFGGRAGMRFVAIRTSAVSGGRRCMLFCMATLAVFGHASRVWLVAPSARRVPDPRLVAYVGVAGVARSNEHGRLMWQPAVAAATRHVSRAHGDLHELFLMTTFTQAVLRQVELEVVRRVAALAGHVPMKAALVRRSLMTAAARPGQGLGLLTCRMRVVARQAGTARDALGMIGMHVPMALCAGGARSATNVVRGVAAGANGVCRHLGLREHDHVGMAGAAGDRLLRLELVRAMTAHALCMTTAEQRCGRHDGLRLAVTAAAGGQRVCRGGMLVRVARGAHAIGRLALCGMVGVDVLVATRAGRRHRCLVLVRAMTAQALTGRVHDHRGGRTLSFQMTTSTVPRAERLEDAAIELIVRATVARESVTSHTVGLRAMAETGCGLALGVLDARFARVTGGAAIGWDASDRRAIERVAAVASDAPLHHMHLMPGRAPIRAPSGLHVQPLARCTGGTAAFGLR
jgi:hypothetical protein